MDTTKTITHLSLCSGYSGIGLGIKRVLPSLREIAHVEIEAFAVANLVAKMEAEQLPAAPIFTNVKTFPYERFFGCVDILSGGFPCQPFSSAGQAQEEQRRASYTGEQLDNSTSERCEGERLRIQQRQEGSVSRRSSEELVYTNSNGHSKHTTTSKAEPIRGAEATIMPRSDELPDTENIGCGGRSNRNICRERSVQEQEAQEQSNIRGKVEGCGRELAQSDGGRFKEPEPIREKAYEFSKTNQHRFPSRPNEPQYEWEQPRTKPRLGGTADGYSSRVDRLRLLGNGVVPLTAEKAFRVLIGRLI